MKMDVSNIPSPCYVLDERALRNNLAIITQVKKRAGVEIIMSLKSFAMWSAFPIFREYIQKAAASSKNEARLAYEEFKSEAYTYSPAYKEEDFQEIISYSSHITFNSVRQFYRFIPYIQNAEKKVSVGLRLNPEFSDVNTSIYNPCLPGSRLGITIEQLDHNFPKEIEGLHFHALCESDSYAMERSLQAFIEKFAHLLPLVSWVNMGGGHLITHKRYDREHLISLLTDFKHSYNVDIILEPGSAFVWDAGYLVATVVDIVENSNIKTAILDVSFSAHMPDTLEMPYKPEIIGATEKDERKPTYKLGGNSCLAGDTIGYWSFEQELKPGDKLVFKGMMDYTMVKTTTFNGIDHPAIGILKENGDFKLVRTFGYKDYKSRLS